MPGESYCRQLRYLLCLCYVFQVLINSLVCWFISRGPVADACSKWGHPWGAREKSRESLWLTVHIRLDWTLWSTGFSGLCATITEVSTPSCPLTCQLFSFTLTVRSTWDSFKLQCSLHFSSSRCNGTPANCLSMQATAEVLPQGYKEKLKSSQTLSFLMRLW